MKTVLRNKEGEITHVLYDTMLVTKKDFEVLTSHRISKKELKKTVPDNADGILRELLNGLTSIQQVRKLILSSNGLLENKDIIQL